ncbi:MAG: FAD-dependent oxidoreductase, partial [Anaerolineaceae bacterium]|nr:FAD-dependent oxidoreductase [Anaerolineaceae bacterium]
MPGNRITSHPILKIEENEYFKFYWQGKEIQSHPGETISSALIANGIKIFGNHPKDNAPLGIFCANGQCSQCMVILNGNPVKACMTLTKPGAHVSPAIGLPKLQDVPFDPSILFVPPQIIPIPVLIIGGGPAGISAAVELGSLGVKALVIDDKHTLGGKLVLQTHRFFGSTDEVYAGTRGIDIAAHLDAKVREFGSVEVWMETTAIAVYEDKTVGVWKNANEYTLVKPDVLLVATGARERSLAFKGNTLPGVYGAGAFQTLANRDLVKPSEDLFIIGGGNVGLIAGYHALQAGINVVGLVEALPECGGYKVHHDKLARLGVPIFTSHSIISANGSDQVESVTIAKVDRSFKPIPGLEKTFKCDSILIAVGLDPVNEFIQKAKEVDLEVFAAGDAEEIAEASAAMFSGKIKGLEIAKYLGQKIPDMPSEWIETEKILKSKPGSIINLENSFQGDVYPVMHCTQEIPCDPCSKVCPRNLIHINKNDIRNVPEFCVEGEKVCIACERCVAICPGLAITLVDYRSDPTHPTVSIPFEFSKNKIKEGDVISVTDVDGGTLLDLNVTKLRQMAAYPGTVIVRVVAPLAIATKIAGIRIIKNKKDDLTDVRYIDHIKDDTYICRCERVTAGEIRTLIRNGVRDINQIKGITKASMGACGGKTCLRMITNIFREENVSLDDVYPTTIRPVFVEMPVNV